MSRRRATPATDEGKEVRIGVMVHSIVISHLEMQTPDALRPGRVTDMQVVRAEIPSPELNRFLYTAVGGDWYWTDLLAWNYEDWRLFVDRPELETWVGYVRGTPAGYFELERQRKGSIDILHFGLLRGFIGRGYGGHLLTEAVRRAWALGAVAVRLNTNTLDGPHALANYLARGFEIVGREELRRHIPDTPPGPWPGAFPKANGERGRRNEE